jgi:hypothetical protein
MSRSATVLNWQAAGEIRRSLASEVLRALETLFQAPRAVLKRAPHGAGTGGEPTLVERHQEADRTSSRILTLGSSPRAFALHKPRHVTVKVELGAVNAEVDRVRDALGKDWLGRPRAIFLGLGKSKPLSGLRVMPSA